MTENGLKERLKSIARDEATLSGPQPEMIMPEVPTIYLTFDDGPGDYTARLLDILAANDVKATFFVTLENPLKAELTGRAFKEGHAIGVHSACHDYEKIYANEAAFYQDFLLCEEMIRAQTGRYSTLFRFPGGSSNTISRHWCTGIMTRLATSMEEMGYRYFDWNVDSDDSGTAKEPEAVLRNVVMGCHGKTASIVLQHDIKSYSVTAAEDIIAFGKSEGFRFRPLDMSSPTMKHRIANESGVWSAEQL